MKNQSKQISIREPLSLILRGGPAVGKSTIAHILATKLERSACIEQDILRYMVHNGLVAAKRGHHPTSNPEEYKRQCDLGDKNVFALVRNFYGAGFTTIIAGLCGGESANSFIVENDTVQNHWKPKKTVFDNELQNIPYFQIVLDTPVDILTHRLIERGFDNDSIDFVLRQREVFLSTIDNDSVAMIIDTSQKSPQSISDDIIRKVISPDY